MAQALSAAIRQDIVSEHGKGKSISALSKEYSVARKTVQILVRRFERDGITGLRPNYSNCGKPKPVGSFSFRAVRYLRHLHPGWGAEKVRAEIQRKYPSMELPHYRTINRWFHWNGQIKKKGRARLPNEDKGNAVAPHECWQVDAKEEMQTMDGNKQCWLNITDEYTGMVIEPPVFPL